MSNNHATDKSQHKEQDRYHYNSPHNHLDRCLHMNAFTDNSQVSGVDSGSIKLQLLLNRKHTRIHLLSKTDLCQWWRRCNLFSVACLKVFYHAFAFGSGAGHSLCSSTNCISM